VGKNEYLTITARQNQGIRAILFWGGESPFHPYQGGFFIKIQ